MPQNPFLTDQVQIEPGSSGTRLINRASDGSLQFQDPSISGAVLSSLLGIRNITGVYVVGRAGDGAAYTAIQDAIDDIPNTSDPSAPSVVVLYPGVYTENLSIVKDGIYLYGVGDVTISNSGASATITISDDPLTTPEQVKLTNLTITNDQDATACVSIQGAGTYASGTVTVNNTLVAGDTLTIGGVVLTGVAGTRTSGSNNFSIDGITTDQVAAEIVAAINDASNSFLVTVEASVTGSVVTITAAAPGAGGNAVTLAASTTPAGGLTVSGANLSGGGSSGSRVAAGGVWLEGCVIQATGNGGFQVDADTVGYIRVIGGTFQGSSGSSLLRAVNCTSVELSGQSQVYAIEVAYDTGNDEPFAAGIGTLALHGARNVGTVSATFVGAGFAALSSCGATGTLTFGGDQGAHIRNSYINGNISVDDTVAVSLFNSTYTGSLVLAGGTPTLDVPYLEGTTAFAASVSETVTFTVPRSSDAYRVVIEPSSIANFTVVRSDTGFDITTTAPFTGDVDWAVIDG